MTVDGDIDGDTHLEIQSKDLLTQQAQSASTATAAMHEDSDDEDDDSDHQKLGRFHTVWQQTWSCFLVPRITGPEHVPPNTATPFLGVASQNPFSLYL